MKIFLSLSLILLLSANNFCVANEFIDCEKKLHSKILKTGSLGIVNRDLYSTLNFPLGMDFGIPCGELYSHVKIGDVNEITKKLNRGLLSESDILNHIVIINYASDYSIFETKKEDGLYFNLFVSKYDGNIKEKVFILKTKHALAKNKKLKNDSNYYAFSVVGFDNLNNTYGGNYKVLVLIENTEVTKNIKTTLTK